MCNRSVYFLIEHQISGRKSNIFLSMCMQMYVCGTCICMYVCVMFCAYLYCLQCLYVCAAIVFNVYMQCYALHNVYVYTCMIVYTFFVHSNVFRLACLVCRFYVFLVVTLNFLHSCLTVITDFSPTGCHVVLLWYILKHGRTTSRHFKTLDH